MSDWEMILAFLMLAATANVIGMWWLSR